MRDPVTLEQRAACLAQTGGRCLLDPSHAATDCHHNPPRGGKAWKGGRGRKELIPLCAACHAEAHGDSKKYVPLLFNLLDEWRRRFDKESKSVGQEIAF